MTWIEYENCYVAQFDRLHNLHKKSLKEIEFDDGVGVVIGENKSKYKSGDYKIGEIVFDKSHFTLEDASDYFHGLDFHFARKSEENKKVPPIAILVDLGKKGYLYGVLRGCEKIGTIKDQLAEMEDVED